MLELSKKAKTTHLSPIRKFYPYAVDAAQRGIKIYHLNIGQPDIPTPKAYFDAIKSADLIADSYAPSLGQSELINAIREYYKRLGIVLNNEEIVVTTGGSEAISMSMFAILNPGDRVIVPEPFYPNYNTIIRAAGGIITPLSTSVENDYFYADPQILKKALRKNTKAILITNPNNPTGTILNDKDMAVIIDFAVKNNLYIVCDEVYREICFTGDKLTSILKNDKVKEHLIVIDSVSKRFSCCGARVGALISKNKNIIESVTKYAQSRLSVSTLNQIGAACMYNSADEHYFESVKNEYKKRCDVMVRELSKIEGVRVSPPKGAFYVMASLPIDNADDFQKFLLTDFNDNNETVMFAPAADFYATKGKGKNEIRLAAVLNESDTERAISILKKGIAAYNAAR